MKNIIRNVSIITLIFIVFSSLVLWMERKDSRAFECRALINSHFFINGCNKTSIFDIFLAINGNGKGYFILTGTWSCPHMIHNSFNTLVDFTYEKAGNYYSLHMGKRDPGVFEVIDELKHDNLKLKLTKVDEYDYKLSTPVQTLMVCTRDAG